TPYSVARDETMQEQLQVPLHGFHDALIMPPGSVMTNKGDPYTVYTPFKKKWRKQSQQSDLAVNTKLHGELYQIQHIDAHDLPTLGELGFAEATNLPEADEVTAQERLDKFLSAPIYGYDETRNELALHPFDGRGGTSQLSPYFRFGILSPRQAVSKARNAYKQAPNSDGEASVVTWVDELIWREFYMHIMAHFPHVYRGNFRSEYDNLPWEDNNDALQRWKDGETGYPIVDAAMRQLKATGWMPNRARMIVSSFLTKDLLIDWREGEKHFMQCLIDGDPAANNGGWQWAAGTGTDAQPYFRIFNPTTQGERFDPDGKYIREWIPELADVAGKTVHDPTGMKRPPSGYPRPIVNHKDARDRTLEVFKQTREAANT
ncbi:MAG: deoxyribodipyrimidine photo-lyase, partial [Chloroflexota bacterium]